MHAAPVGNRLPIPAVQPAPNGIQALLRRISAAVGRVFRFIFPCCCAAPAPRPILLPTDIIPGPVEPRLNPLHQTGPRPDSGVRAAEQVATEFPGLITINPPPFSDPRNPLQFYPPIMTVRIDRGPHANSPIEQARMVHERLGFVYETTLDEIIRYTGNPIQFREWLRLTHDAIIQTAISLAANAPQEESNDWPQLQLPERFNNLYAIADLWALLDNIAKMQKQPRRGVVPLKAEPLPLVEWMAHLSRAAELAEPITEMPDPLKLALRFTFEQLLPIREQFENVMDFKDPDHVQRLNLLTASYQTIAGKLNYSLPSHFVKIGE